ncbi:hypothetical protein I3W98_20515, partial [Streptomyces cavourensis]|nr:hypothetical protein [Streptomyces cavourensis]
RRVSMVKRPRASFTSLSRWLSAARTAVSELAERLHMPQENLITPDTVRRVCWEPPKSLTPGAVEDTLAAYGARHWQIEQVGPLLVRALAAGA